MPSLKSALKSFKPAYRLNSCLRAWRQQQIMDAEQHYYVRMAQRRAVIYSGEETVRALRRKLSGKGLRPKRKGDFHVVYVSQPTNWETHNIPPQLEKFGKVTPFYWGEKGFDGTARDWLARRSELDRTLMSFVEQLHRHEPIDVVLFYVTGWELSPETVRVIGGLGIFTCNFCWDDKLKFRKHIAGGRYAGVAPLASAFDLNLTNAPSSRIKYLVEGGLSLLWPEGANPEFYKPSGEPFKYDVTFVGQMYGPRPLLIDYLREHGVRITVFGAGTDGGFLKAEEIPRVYSQSRINLGYGGVGHTSRTQCLKARDFEVPMSGGLYLSSCNPDLELCYEIGQEILCYRNWDECLTLIQRYLNDDQEASRVRKAGYLRVLKDHTWERRFDQLLAAAGLLQGT